MSNIINPVIYERGHEFLKSKILSDKAIDQQFKNDVQNSLKKAREVDYYFRKKLDLTQLDEVIQSTDDKKRAITNLDKGMIGKGIYAACVAISIQYAKDATLSNPDEVVYNNTVYSALDVAADDTDLDAGATGNQFGAVPTQRIPTAFVNAEMKLKVGEIVSFEAAVEDLLIKDWTKRGIDALDENIKILKEPFLIAGDAKIGLQFLLPTNGAMGTGNHFINLKMFCIAIGDRA